MDRSKLFQHLMFQLLTAQSYAEPATISTVWLWVFLKKLKWILVGTRQSRFAYTSEAEVSENRMIERVHSIQTEGNWLFANSAKKVSHQVASFQPHHFATNAKLDVPSLLSGGEVRSYRKDRFSNCNCRLNCRHCGSWVLTNWFRHHRQKRRGQTTTLWMNFAFVTRWCQFEARFVHFFFNFIFCVQRAWKNFAYLWHLRRNFRTVINHQLRRTAFC